MRKIILSVIVLTLALSLFSFPSVSAQYYTDNNRYSGSFQPSYYTYQGSFRPYHSSYSYSPYYNSGNRIYTYPSNYYRYPSYDYLNTPTYLSSRSNPSYNSNPSYSSYNSPIYLNSPSSAEYYYDPYPQSYNSRTNTFNNRDFQDFTQNSRINSLNSYSYNQQPCQTYSRHINLDGKRNDVRFTEQLCNGITINQANSNSYSNNLNNNFGNNYRTFGNSQFYYF